jgi:PS-10 peptidase S37
MIVGAAGRGLVLGSLLLAGCGDNLAVGADAAQNDVSSAFVGRLLALPNVHDVTEVPTQTPGFHYFVLHFTQPVDHADPQSATFLQEVSLLHKDTAAPLVVHTSGYWDYYHDRAVELTQLLDANQISIEHRYFAESRPDPADWSKLTIEQMADDEHAIVTALRTIYTGKAISTGGSKGGMTAIFYRRFFPDDVDGTVPYVAPISFAAPDSRYTPFFATVGPPACRQAVRDVATEMLANRRAALEARTQTQATQKGYTYTRVALGPVVESAIDELEWSFWQYFGVNVCSQVPPVTASDDAMFAFLDAVDPPSDSDDDQTALFDAYYYQAYFQLGYPEDNATYLAPYLMYTDADYANALPTAEPTYDGGVAMTDIADFVKQGDRFVFVYGEWDPWTAGAFDLGGATDSLRLIQAHGTHGSNLTHLAQADMTAAFAKLEAWTGVTPVIPARLVVQEPHTPHIPAAVVRALRARRHSH